MTRGFDLWVAELVLQLRSSGYEIEIICALPYEGFVKDWNSKWQRKYHQIISRADLIKCISPHYSHITSKSATNGWLIIQKKIIAIYNGNHSAHKTR